MGCRMHCCTFAYMQNGDPLLLNALLHFVLMPGGNKALLALESITRPVSHGGLTVYCSTEYFLKC